MQFRCISLAEYRNVVKALRGFRGYEGFGRNPRNEFVSPEGVILRIFQEDGKAKIRWSNIDGM